MHCPDRPAATSSEKDVTIKSLNEEEACYTAEWLGLNILGCFSVLKENLRLREFFSQWGSPLVDSRAKC